MKPTKRSAGELPAVLILLVWATALQAQSPPSVVAGQLHGVEGSTRVTIEFETRDDRARACVLAIARPEGSAYQVSTTASAPGSAVTTKVSLTQELVSVGKDIDALVASYQACQTHQRSRFSWSLSRTHRSP